MDMMTIERRSAPVADIPLGIQHEYHALLGPAGNVIATLHGGKVIGSDGRAILEVREVWGGYLNPDREDAPGVEVFRGTADATIAEWEKAKTVAEWINARGFDYEYLGDNSYSSAYTIDAELGWVRQEIPAWGISPGSARNLLDLPMDSGGRESPAADLSGFLPDLNPEMGPHHADLFSSGTADLSGFDPANNPEMGPHHADLVNSGSAIVGDRETSGGSGTGPDGSIGGYGKTK